MEDVVISKLTTALESVRHLRHFHAGHDNFSNPVILALELADTEITEAINLLGLLNSEVIDLVLGDPLNEDESTYNVAQVLGETLLEGDDEEEEESDDGENGGEESDEDVAEFVAAVEADADAAIPERRDDFTEVVVPAGFEGMAEMAI